jgi:putative ABC transport system permease protein
MANRQTRILREALVALGRNKVRTFFMTLGIVLGVGCLTAVLCIGQGTRDKVMNVIATHGLDMLMVRAGAEKQIFAPTADRAIASLVEGDASAIEAEIPNVVAVSPVQNQRGLETQYKDRSVSVRVFGVAPPWNAIRRKPVARGEFITHDDMAHAAKVAVLGHRTALTLFGDEDPIGQTVRIANDPYVVRGVFAEVGASAAGEDFDDRVVVPLTTSMRRLFKRPYFEQIVLQIRDVDRMKETAESVRKLLRERHQIRDGAQDDFFVREPKDVTEAALSTSATLTRLLLGISVVALLIGGVVIMNVMLVSVGQRLREIGLRRAVGARRRDIVLQFLLEALGVATLGAGIGVALGAAVATALGARGVAVSRLTAVPILVAVGVSVAVTLLFGLHPARKAAGVNPVVALRGGEQR